MAEKVPFSVTALSQAAAGRQLPTLAVTLAYVDVCGGDVGEWERRWRDASAEAAALAAADEEARPPYRGLASLRTGRAALFFGRDRLVDRLDALTRRHRFTAVFGPSGSGKSSLLRAGLIPACAPPRPAPTHPPPPRPSASSPPARPRRPPTRTGSTPCRTRTPTPG